MPSLQNAYNWMYQKLLSEKTWYCNSPRTGGKIYRNGKQYEGYDCSGILTVALQIGGFNINNTTTAYIPNKLKSLGFTEIAITSTTEVKIGDIVHIYSSERNTKYGHVEMIYKTGSVTISGKNGGACSMGASTVHGSPMGLNPRPNPIIKDFKRILRYNEDITGGESETVKYNFNDCALAGMAGSITVECTWNPNCTEQGRGYNNRIPLLTTQKVGYGILQATNTGGDSTGRLYNFVKYLSDTGYLKFNGLTGKVEYLNPDGMCEWYRSYEDQNFKGDGWLDRKGWKAKTGITSTLDYLNYNWTSPTEAAECFMNCSVRIPFKQERATYAEHWYDYMVIQGHKHSTAQWIVDVNDHGYWEREGERAKNNCIAFWNSMCGGVQNDNGEVITKLKSSLYTPHLIWRYNHD